MLTLRNWLSAIAAVLLSAIVMQSGALAQQISADDDDDDDGPPATQFAPASGPPANLPSQELTGQTLYDFLIGEIAAQRGSPGLAAQTFLELAKRTRDPRVARRAVEVANFARMPGVALESARIWHESDPGSAQALQAVTVLLIQSKRVEEAEPYIVKLLAPDAKAAANGFMQLARLLGSNPDTAANLRVMRNLAAKYPDLPQAHLALSQVAAAANDEALALAEVRSAMKLRPDWEIAAMYEAQLLQRRSPGEAAKHLAAFLEKYPDSRDVRLSHARMLVLDKRYPEAREAFESILKRFPKDIDAIYAVGLLAFQVKEYGVAEANMKRLLDLGYRDANSVRFTLGQIAEEQHDWPRAIQGTTRSSAATRRCRRACAPPMRLPSRASWRRRAITCMVSAWRPSRNACSCWLPNRNCCAMRTCIAKPSTCSARRCRKRRTSPSCCTTMRSPRKSWSASRSLNRASSV